MSDSDFQYLFPVVQGSVLNDYLAQTYSIESRLSDSSTTRCFSCHYRKQLPDSFQQVRQHFPSLCFDFQNDDQQSCFLIAAAESQFYELLTYASTLDCKSLSDALLEGLTPRQNSFQIQGKTWSPEKPKLMAILNITPDSFYDGGKYFQKERYDDIAEQLIQQGADIIDIGGESTRPGSTSVSAAEEIQRVLPVLEQIRSRFSIPISIDTVKPEVAEVVLQNGADMINDTSGLSGGNKMLEVLKRYDASYCLMHIQGTPQTMQKAPVYSDVIADVYRFFQDKLDLCYKAGLAPDRICIDPGIGFGKTFSHNIFLLRFLSAFSNLNRSILIGTSNKSFIGKMLDTDTDDRLTGSIATQIIGHQNGANIFRVHNVKETNDALKVVTYFE